jgi:hypothetical protein
MENELANLKSEPAAITLWNRLFADLEDPGEIDRDAFVARFCRRQVILQRLKETIRK